MPSDFATPARPAAFSFQAEPDQGHAPDAADNPDQNAPDQDGQSNEDPAQEDLKPGEADAPEDGGAPAEPPVEPSPVEPPPVEPSPVEPPPVEPSPVEPPPVEPSPVEPPPVEPPPVEPPPVEPQPDEPSPVEPPPVEPPPVEPPPVEPPPDEPPPVEPPPVEPPPGESPSYVDEHIVRGPNSIALVMPALKLQASASNELVFGETISIVVGNKTDMAAGAKFLYTAAPLEVKVNVGFNVVSDRSTLLRRANNEKQITVKGVCIAQKHREYKDLCRQIEITGEDMKRTEDTLQLYATRQEVEAIQNDIGATVTSLNDECTTAVAQLNTVAAQSTNLAENSGTTVGVANTLAGSTQSTSAESTRTAAACTQSHASSSTLAAQSTVSTVATMLN